MNSQNIKKFEVAYVQKVLLKKMSHKKPLITVITAVFNSENHLEECLTSLQSEL